MIFGGFQKLTLLDFPGKVACILFTKGCNFYCPFCHNALLVKSGQDTEEIASESVLAYLKKRKGILEGVCITGGEPLMQPEIEDFIRSVKELGYAVKLDTNGSFPAKLKQLVSQNLIDYVAMDVKNCPEKYALTTGCPALTFGDVEESLDFLLSDAVDYELRTTVVNELHTPQDIEEIARRIRGAKRYFLQNFVDSGHLLGSGLSPVSAATMQNMQEKAKKFVENTQIRG